ncbi:hypothetical protein AGMMS50293_10380 [Spirochaetia bacterium]|nr:hypothetical protein AGMMS50293_10380 [Spirochaetia bacterium]
MATNGVTKRPLLGNVHPAVIAVWAAIVAAGHILPTIPVFGTGSTFSLTAALSPLSGIFFGPIAGALCSAAGGFVGNLIAPHTAWMGMGTFIIGTTSAFTSGCIAWGGRPLVAVNRGGAFVINGGIIVYIIGTILWFTQDIGRSVPLFPLVYYGAGFIALVVGSLFSGRMFASPRKALKLPAIWLCAFGGLIGGATVGNFFSVVLYRLPRELWLTLTVAAPLERAVFASGAMLIGAPLLAGLPQIGVFVGPGQDDTSAGELPDL